MIKKWFVEKNFTSEERYAISVSDGYQITKETEKAVCCEWSTDFGKITKWIPKSCLMTEEDLIEESNRIKERNTEYENLINFAKENGIKGVRKGMKKQTILEKISQSGLQY